MPLLEIQIYTFLKYWIFPTCFQGYGLVVDQQYFPLENCLKWWGQVLSVVLSDGFEQLEALSGIQQFLPVSVQIPTKKIVTDMFWFKSYMA